MICKTFELTEAVLYTVYTTQQQKHTSCYHSTESTNSCKMFHSSYINWVYFTIENIFNLTYKWAKMSQWISNEANLTVYFSEDKFNQSKQSNPKLYIDMKRPKRSCSLLLQNQEHFAAKPSSLLPSCLNSTSCSVLVNEVHRLLNQARWWVGRHKDPFVLLGNSQIF